MNDQFATRADEFITRVRGATIEPSTEVVLIYHCVDQEGKEVPPIRVSLEPTTTVKWPDNQEFARQFAVSMHLDSIIGNINSLVRQAPEGPVMLRGGPKVPVTIRDFSLEIVQPDDTHSSEHPVMSITLQAEAPPLCPDSSGALRVGESRVLLELVIRAFQDGAPPETIVQRYPTLALADVYAVVAYYLRHRSEVEEYLARREQEAEETQKRIESQQGDLSEIRRRLAAQRQT